MESPTTISRQGCGTAVDSRTGSQGFSLSPKRRPICVNTFLLLSYSPNLKKKSIIKIVFLKLFYLLYCTPYSILSPLPHVFNMCCILIGLEVIIKTACVTGLSSALSTIGPDGPCRRLGPFGLHPLSGPKPHWVIKAGSFIGPEGPNIYWAQISGSTVRPLGVRAQ